MLWRSGLTCYVVLNSGRHCNAERFGAGQNRLSDAIIAFSNRYARVGFVTQNGSGWASETEWVVTAAIGCLAVGMAAAGVPRTPGLERSRSLKRWFPQERGSVRRQMMTGEAIFEGTAIFSSSG